MKTMTVPFSPTTSLNAYVRPSVARSEKSGAGVSRIISVTVAAMLTPPHLTIYYGLTPRATSGGLNNILLLFLWEHRFVHAVSRAESSRHFTEDPDSMALGLATTKRVNAPPFAANCPASSINRRPLPFRQNLGSTKRPSSSA